MKIFDNKKAWQLILFAASALYLQLAIIRFTAAEVLYLGYFSNFILISAFVGLGLGFLSFRKGIRFDKYVPSALLFLFALVLVSEFDVSMLSNHFGLFFFSNVSGRAGLPGALLLVILFISTVVLFIGIGNRIAYAFSHFKPLKAYSLDIVGSLLGIALFSLQSVFASSPVVWVVTGCSIFALAYLVSANEDRIKRVAAIYVSCFCVVMLLLSANEGKLTVWSTYQKLVVYEKGEAEFSSLYANGILHQNIIPASVAINYFYRVPYEVVAQTEVKLDDVLIIGAGTGTDVSVALLSGARSIDAVEIDERILQLGKLLHPDRPYSDPRVTAHATDGRRFLGQTDKKYDLIIFALPDSLMRLSAMSSVRLESYLFTLEAMAEVKNHLKDNGVFIMYNQYRWQWLVNKLSTAMETVFNVPPVQISDGYTTMLAIGGDLQGSEISRKGFNKLATDDWPFVYMQKPGVHWLYIGVITMFLLTSLVGVYFLAPKGTLNKPYLHFFFMGMAFLLLETKSLVFFSLLFGTTWLVNSLAFTGILLSVLVANLVVQNFHINNRKILYVGLFLSLALAYVIPVNLFLEIEIVLLRYILAILISFTPIFFANLIFSCEFKDSEESTKAFGWNLLGAVAGGALEYMSLVIGFKNLLWIVGLCYVLVMIFGHQYNKRLAVTD